MTALADVCSAYPALMPPNRVTVAQGAASILKITRPGGGGGYWSPAEAPYMVTPMNTLTSRRHAAVCFVGPAQSGKCLDVETPIPTPSGWSRMGDLAAGDEVYGPDGRAARVLKAHPVLTGRPCFEVEFSDGNTLVADDEHLWGVERFYWREPNWRYEVRTTAQLLADLTFSARTDGRCRFRFRVRNTEPLQAPDAGLPIDPYLLGVWLGDGATRQSTISSHRDDAGHYLAAFARAGHRADAVWDGENTVFIRVDLRERLTTHCQRGHVFADTGRDPGMKCSECRRTNYARNKRGEALTAKPMFADTFVSRLHALGVHGDKHIPRAYLRASAAQRLALFQGLMDTDGSCDPRVARCEFSSTNPALVEGFRELARSLGLKPSTTFKTTSWEYLGEKRQGVAWRLGFPVPAGLQVFSLPRKANQLCPAQRDVGYRQIVSITPVESRPVRCIQVDNSSSLFLAGLGMVPTHNTVALVDAWMAHNVVNDPGDMLIVQMTQDKAREFSKQRLDRAIKNSPKLKATQSALARDDNTHDKLFRNGMWVRLGWPTATNFASTSYRYVAGTDYDRWADDIDGEGDGFALMSSRPKTFLSRGMVAVESSPSRPVTDPGWRPASAHEAPPVGGILGIYNRSDRQRLYWQCPHCREHFQAEPGLGLFRLPDDDTLLEGIRDLDIDVFARQHARVPCPHCGAIITPRQREQMNAPGLWLPDGVTIDERGRISGTPRTSSIAGFWLGGVAATYVTWETLIRKHLQALLEFSLTGGELQLMTTANTDQGMPYMSRMLAAAKAGAAHARYDANLKRYHVPDEARFLVTSVDVQGGRNARFEVQVHAIGPHQEQWLVNRFAITESNRDGFGDQKAPLDPASYPEDWDVLTEQVVKATYRTSDPNREMRVKLTVVDSGGEDGVTNNAYAWFRRLRKAGLQSKARLTKGANTKVDWHIRETMVGGRQGKGDVPLQLLDPNKFKDLVWANYQRKTPGPGYYHFPEPRHPERNPTGWLPQAFYDELHAEVRNENGVWEQVKKRNETVDLCCMIRAGCMMLGADKRTFWDNPPAWALPHDQNSEIVVREVRQAEQDRHPAVLARPASAPAQWVRRSSYLA